MLSRNARDDLFNGASVPALNQGREHAEMKAALDEFNAKLPAFCRTLGITPAVLNINTPTLLLLVCIRQQEMIDSLMERTATKEPTDVSR